MLRIAIVEDEEKEARKLNALLEKFSQDKAVEFQVFQFLNPVFFLNNYSADYDLIFMDIQMPYMDGIEASQKLREIDSFTMLVFVTNMAFLAGKGYEVEAFDFLVKPIDYEYFVNKMTRIINALNRRQEKKIIIQSEGIKHCIPISSIIYIEVANHSLIYHTEDGDFNSYGTMKKAQESLFEYDFELCNNCYLVNLSFVKNVRQFIVKVGNEELKISRPKKKSFMEALNNYIGG